MLQLRALAASLVVVLLVTPATAAGKVWVVGPAGAPGVDFSTLQGAVGACTSGDLILVRPGTSPGDTYVNRHVAIVGDNGGAPVTLAGRLAMVVPQVGQPQLLRGLEVHADSQSVLEFYSAGSFLDLAWIEDCAFVASAATHCCAYGAYAETKFLPDPKGLFAATRVRFAASGSDSGAIVSGPHVALWNCSCEGGGGYVTGTIGHDGGAGLQVYKATLFASGCRFVGGDGGDSAPGTCGGSKGKGGSALHIEAPAGLVDCQLVPGTGAPLSGPCAPGATGLPIKPPTAQVVHFPGTARSLALAAPVREGQTLVGSLTGEPGELALVGWSLGTANVPMGSLVGVLVLAAPFQVMAIGVVPPSGTLPIAAAVQELGAGVEFAVVYFQSAFVSAASASAVLGSPSAAILLDSAY